MFRVVILIYLFNPYILKGVNLSKYLPQYIHVSRPIISKPEEIDLAELEKRFHERKLLETYNSCHGGQRTSLYEPLPTPRKKSYDHSIFPEIDFHIVDEESLPQIIKGPYPGLRGSPGLSSGDLHSTNGWPFGNRSGPSFGFKSSDRQLIEGINGRGTFSGVPSSKLRFIAARNLEDVYFSVVWINSDYVDWFEKEVRPGLLKLDEFAKSTRANGRYGPQFVTSL